MSNYCRERVFRKHRWNAAGRCKDCYEYREGCDPLDWRPKSRSRNDEPHDIIYDPEDDEEGLFEEEEPQLSTKQKVGLTVGAGLVGLALGLRHDPNKRWSVFKKK